MIKRVVDFFGDGNMRNPLDRQETDVTLIRFAAASGALGMAR